MWMKGISRSLAMLSMILIGAAMAETGLIYDTNGNVWRNSHGECWTNSDGDREQIGNSCFGEPLTQADADTDRDGVINSKDACEETPAGTPVDASGCPIDSDGDGVADASDRCAGTPAGVKVDEDGCVSDSDGDGVADSGDACPGTPDGSTVNGKGCAVRIVLKSVNFQLNSDELTQQSKSSLDWVASSLKSRSNLRSISIIGHTDATGDADYNRVLSEKRANAVAKYLLSQGIDDVMLRAWGMGKESPLADNGSVRGRAANRRVEVKLE